MQEFFQTKGISLIFFSTDTKVSIAEAFPTVLAGRSVTDDFR